MDTRRCVPKHIWPSLKSSDPAGMPQQFGSVIRWASGEGLTPSAHLLAHILHHAAVDVIRRPRDKAGAFGAQKGD